MRKLSYIFTLALAVWSTSCKNNNQNDIIHSKEKVKVGDVYLYSRDWKPENPFEKIRIDTVKVIDVKGKYVKWLPWYNDSTFYLSGRLNYFKQNIKHILH